ncbi:MAG TPA: hypothetical protein VFM70_03130 [Salinimicrobium sp.]|nr:hypothetical protein [Salinimicrobium sp.]
MPIKKIISSLQRSQRKRRVIKTILETPQKNESVVNIHRIDTRNIGDYYSAPHHYFEKIKNTSVDIFDYKKSDPVELKNFIEKISNNAVIVGGGGLLNRNAFYKQMQLFQDLTAKGKKTVLWGVGHNDKNPQTYGKLKHYNIDVSKFGLVGTRDFSMPGEYVPCVSCMNSVFDRDYKITQETGIVFHKDTLKKPKILNRFKDFPSTSNTTNLEELINFIGSSENIITDSYHAMYWSMLLGKKVVVVPNSSKFYDFKYKPVISTFENSLEDLSKANVYSGVLEECREINKNFAQKVFNYLEI